MKSFTEKSLKQAMLDEATRYLLWPRLCCNWMAYELPSGNVLQTVVPSNGWPQSNEVLA